MLGVPYPASFGVALFPAPFLPWRRAIFREDPPLVCIFREQTANCVLGCARIG